MRKYDSVYPVNQRQSSHPIGGLWYAFRQFTERTWRRLLQSITPGGRRGSGNWASFALFMILGSALGIAALGGGELQPGVLEQAMNAFAFVAIIFLVTLALLLVNWLGYRVIPFILLSLVFSGFWALGWVDSGFFGALVLRVGKALLRLMGIGAVGVAFLLAMGTMMRIHERSRSALALLALVLTAGLIALYML